jgi:putative heme-binding domain-containing protein
MHHPRGGHHEKPAADERDLNETQSKKHGAHSATTARARNAGAQARRILRGRWHLCAILAPLFFFGAGLRAVGAESDQPRLRTETEILKSIKLPEGYQATIFAKPPELAYPTAVSAAPDGTLFIAVDENGSLGNDSKRGRIVRIRDVDGDGHADEFKVFASMDSPRGVIWDGTLGKPSVRVHVMHPPNLTTYIDEDGDGVAERSEEIITGLGFDLRFRGADHTTNGCRLGIDGFIYVAVGDYGFINATARDGTKLTLRGGGIVRVRPDGTGFEIVSRGQRNIYDVAISPELDLFTRDNTNDGGGWDVRLSFVPPGAHMGYPTLFKNFSEEMLQPLADYGGGSPCGALWIDEPGLPHGLYTVEWGRNAIMFHPLTAAGAGWKADQREWLKLVRPTDIDVDATGRIYVTSWEGATFNYNGPNAGYILRLTKQGAGAPSSAPAPSSDLVAQLFSQSAVERLAAQRTFVAATNDDQAAGALAAKLGPPLASPAQPLPGRIAALFLYAQLAHKLHPDAPFAPPKTPPGLERYVLLVLGDNGARLGSKIDAKWLREGLRHPDPAVRAAAITAARRLGKNDEAANILPLVADPDPVVNHLAIRALTALDAAEVCLGALDSADEKIKPGALRALSGMPEARVVDGLIARINVSEPATRRGIWNALCRLANQDAPYESPREWWGTRPDTTGPVYKPVRWAESGKIEGALGSLLEKVPPDDAKWLVQRMFATRVNYPGLVELMLAKAGSDTTAKLAAIEGMFRNDDLIPNEAAAALKTIAMNEAENPPYRAKALRLLARAAGSATAFPIAIEAFGKFAGRDLSDAPINAAFEDFTHDARNARRIRDYRRIASDSADANQRTLAQTVLLNLATSALVKGREKENAENAVAAAWHRPETAASLLAVIARSGAKQYADAVRARLRDPDNRVAEAALYAFQKLGLNDAPAPSVLIGAMPYADAFSAVQNGGDAAVGKAVYLRAGCIACHTVDANEPAKGPVLSAVAKIYDRAALTESILKPSAKIAQGFESAWFKTKKGEQIEGFVVREAGDSVELRNVAGQSVTLSKPDIAERGKRDQSMMPEGLMNAFSPADFASLLTYLQSLKSAP